MLWNDIWHMCVWIFTSALGAWKINYIIFLSYFYVLWNQDESKEKPPKSPSYEHINKLSSHNTLKWQSMSSILRLNTIKYLDLLFASCFHSFIIIFKCLFLNKRNIFISIFCSMLFILIFFFFFYAVQRVYFLYHEHLPSVHT